MSFVYLFFNYLTCLGCKNGNYFSHLFTSNLLGPVTEVKTDIYVTSFGPVSDVEMVGIWEILCTF